jgi:outer membrane protein assembly factor BamB
MRTTMLWVWAVVGLWLSGLPAYGRHYELTNVWSVIIGDRSDSSAALGLDGTLFFGARDGRFWAIDTNGVVKWVFRADREIKSSPALGLDGTVYFGSRDRHFYAVGGDGRLKWRFRTGGWVDASPALARDGTVYFGSWDKSFYALKPDGAKAWQFDTLAPIVSSPVIARDGTILFGSHDQRCYALSPAGKKKWEFQTGGPIVSSPALSDDGGVYFSSVDGWFYAVNLDGSLRWRLHTGGVTESSPVLGQDGTIYVGVNQELWALSPEGKLRWPRWNEEPIEAAPVALAERCVVYIARSGSLLTLDDNREPVCKYYCHAGGYACPAVGPAGNTYLSERYMYFSAFDSHLPLARSPWPRFRGNPRNTGNIADSTP